MATYELRSWRDFSAIVDDTDIFNTGLDYVWRGQRCSSWPLATSLDRLIQRLGLLEVPSAELEKLAKAHLERFRYAARGRRGPNPPRMDTDNDWWALGQHYGLATPLLDWSHSPFAAAYFAFEETGEGQSECRSIYALSRVYVELQTEALSESLSVESGRMPIVEFVDPMSDENPRLVSQGGLFTRAPLGESLEQWVQRTFEGLDINILVRINVPDVGRIEFLRMLQRMNIHQLSLFPDLTGASRYPNLAWELE